MAVPDDVVDASCCWDMMMMMTLKTRRKEEVHCDPAQQMAQVVLAGITRTSRPQQQMAH